jgi:hypothetical protein
VGNDGGLKLVPELGKSRAAAGASKIGGSGGWSSWAAASGARVRHRPELVGGVGRISAAAAQEQAGHEQRSSVRKIEEKKCKRKGQVGDRWAWEDMERTLRPCPGRPKPGPNIVDK